MARFSNPNPQFLDENGKPYSGGKLYSYTVGTLTPATTYSDNTLSTPNANPIILDSNGRPGSVFFSGQLRFVLDDADDVEVWDEDYVGDAGASGQFDDWDSSTTYEVNDIVNDSGVFYISIAGTNLNNDPSSSATKWTQVNIIRTWNTNETYDNQELVIRSGLLYSSLAGSNSGNDPATDQGNWRPLQPDAMGIISGASTVDGYGIASCSTSGNDHTVTFSNAASAAGKQVVLVEWPAPNATDFYEGGVDKSSTTAVIVRQYLGSTATPTATAAYPIGITRWLFD